MVADLQIEAEEANGGVLLTVVDSARLTMLLTRETAAELLDAIDACINYRDDEHRGLSLPGSENGANRWLTPPTFVPFPRDWWRNILG